MNEQLLIILILNCRNYCASLIEQETGILDEIKECLDQKKFKQYSVTAKEVGIDYKDVMEQLEHFEATRLVQFLLRFTSNKRNVYEEVLIFDYLGLVGSTGGSLGLFIGFSFFGYVTPILDVLFDKVVSFLLRTNQSN